MSTAPMARTRRITAPSFIPTSNSDSPLEVRLHSHLNQSGRPESGDLPDRRTRQARCRTVPVGVVHDVEEIRTHLEPPTLLELECAAQGHVPLNRAGTVKDIA